ncbi:MAG: hypothetical protein ACLP29_04990 [Dissulfurispiraceae bacterium]
MASPVISSDDLMGATPNKDSVAGLILSIKANEIISCFYLPPINSLPERYIDFSKMASDFGAQREQ